MGQQREQAKAEALPAELRRRIDWRRSVPRDFFRVIEQPRYIAASRAGDTMSDDEQVLGLELDGQCRAYPINYLNDHEMVQETIGRWPVLVTW